MAYFERDAEEIQQVLSTSGSHEMREIFLQMVVAKRLQARSLLDVDACPVVLESGKASLGMSVLAGAIAVITRY
eukprot:gene20348-24372_t